MQCIDLLEPHICTILDCTLWDLIYMTEYVLTNIVNSFIGKVHLNELMYFLKFPFYEHIVHNVCFTKT